jgi:membrane-associated phospholipid phosphatase
MKPEITQRSLRNAFLGFTTLVVAFILARLPGFFDIPVARFLNSLANRNKVLDWAAHGVYAYPSLSSVLLMSLVWASWFQSEDAWMRSRIFVATTMALGAGIISRLFQHTLPTHPRPIFDPALNFQKPSTLENVYLNTWNSFPSDHATLLSGLFVTLWIAKSPFRYALLVFLPVVEIARAYMGAHYPTDLIAGAGLAICVVWSTQSEPFLRLGRWAVALEARNKALFYGLSYYICYQIVTYFVDLRSLAVIVLPFGQRL